MGHPMKEHYFTTDNIEAEALQMLYAICRQDRDRGMPFNIDRAALLVIDMQDYFLQPSSHAFIPSAPAIIPAIEKLTASFYARRRPVIFTRQINSPDDAGMMAKWWHDLIRREDPMSNITDSLDTSGSTIMEKCQYDAFYQTPLQRLLDDQKVEQVVITGVMTNLCCETTARSAFVHGYQVFFVVDGTATYNADMHRATLLNLAYGFGSLVLTHQLLTTSRHDDED